MNLTRVKCLFRGHRFKRISPYMANGYTIYECVDCHKLSTTKDMRCEDLIVEEHSTIPTMDIRLESVFDFIRNNIEVAISKGKHWTYSSEELIELIKKSINY